jgi:hypothetical protein
MAKQVLKIDKFHGGISNDAHSRDISEDEVASAFNVDFSKVGKLAVLPIGVYHAGHGTNTTYNSNIEEGYGLFHFKSDFARDGTVAKTNYYAVSDPTNYEVDIRDGSNAWASRINWNSTNLGTADNGSTGLRAVYYYADGALRVSDANFTAESYNKWYGNVGDLQGGNLVLFKNASTTQTITKGFKHGAAKVYKPSASYFEFGETSPTATAEHAPGLPGDAGDITNGGSTGTMTVEVTEDVLYDAGVTTLHFAEVTYQAFDEGAEEGNDTAYSVQLKAGQASSVSGDTVSWAGGWPKTSTQNYTGGQEASTLTLNLGANTMTNGAATKWVVQVIGTIGYGDNANLELSCNANSVVFRKTSAAEVAHTSLGVTNIQAGFGFDNDDDAHGWDAEWQVGVSFLYDIAPHTQESLISEMGDVSSPSTNFFTVTGESHAPVLSVYVKYTSAWSDRITGARLYMRKRDSGEWHPQATLDFVEGTVKSHSSGDVANCTYDTANTQYVFRLERENMLSPDFTSTFRVESGYNEDEEAVTALFKTATLASRVAYIGNVKILKEDGTTEVLSDTVLKSIPGKFDIFPLSNRIDVAIKDGEDITALNSFANRLLQFKQNTLYIVNISNYGSEYLESKHEFMGVEIPSAVTVTEFGVAWVNKFGCFFFDGQSAPRNLLMKKGFRKISETDWTAFINDDSIIGYSPKDKKLVAFSTASSSSNDVFVYDFITQSWTSGDGRQSSATTNTVVDHNGSLFWGDSDNTYGFQIWQTGAYAHGTFNCTTKDIDFGQPALRKNIYKVYVTYKSTDGSNIPKAKIYYGTDGGAVNSAFATGTGYNTTSGFSASATYTTVELTPSSAIKNARSIQLKVEKSSEASIDSGFEISDISIVYRAKHTV